MFSYVKDDISTLNLISMNLFVKFDKLMLNFIFLGKS